MNEGSAKLAHGHNFATALDQGLASIKLGRFEDMKGGALRDSRDPRSEGEGAEEAVAYAVARRHSRRVRVLKFAIPLGAAAAVGVILFIGLFDPFHRLGHMELGPVSLSGTKVTMEQPKLTGYRKDAQPYEVTAVSATQDIRKPTIVELKELKARIMLDGDKAARLEAASGVYDTQNEKLVLKESVRVKSDAGYDAWLTSADVDFKAGTVVSKEPVRVTMTNGTVEADTLDMRDNGRVVVFAGRVRTVLNGAQQALAAPAQAPAKSR